MIDISARSLTRQLRRVGTAAQNAMEVARFGGLDTGEEPAPYEVRNQHPVYRLRHYGTLGGEGPPIVLVPPLMLSADVYDVSPSTSAVRELAGHGLDPWVVDFGAPEHEEGGLERTLADHIVAVSDAVERVKELTGSDVILSGYSQGGMFCYQAASYRRCADVSSIVVFGSPVDTREAVPLGISPDLVTALAGGVAGLPPISMPAWLNRMGFRLLDPVKSLRQRLDFMLQLHDREALLEREGQRRFLMADGWVAWPGPAMMELVQEFIANNRMLAGGISVDGRMVTLADLTVPILAFVGTVDEIAPPLSVRAVQAAAPRCEVYERTMRAGHFGLVVGTKAVEETWPVVAQWARWQAGDGPRPHDIVDMADVEEPGSAPISRASYAVELASEVGRGIARSLSAAAERTGANLRDLAGESLDTLPRLARLERREPNARVSLGAVLDEQARRAPDSVFFLFDDRGHTYADAKRRIDNIVRGLVSVGVRQGEHVGVLMGTRPTGLALVAALNRLGAVAVMLRPDGELGREVELTQLTRIIADPEHSDIARTVKGLPVLVLGGGGEPRELGFGLTDMERIDPDEVPLPGWYSPNPGRAQDTAFVLFTGRGERTRVNRITNRRWALSAYGTASAAHLGRSDTVYGLTPLHHPSGLLTSIGGAVAGGARLALTSSFDPTTFWAEVRRYGVTVVSYTWTMLNELTEAPPDPNEHGHPVRLFMGSGMPSGLWRRVVDRFAPAAVLEFYAANEAEVVLANVSSEKVGAKGRPIPGSARVRLAKWDLDQGRLIEGSDGFAVRCETDEVGMLLARVDPGRATTPATPLRGVFSPNDAWVATGELFRRDVDGDHWLVDHTLALIRGATGPIPSVPIEDALGTIPGVDLVAAYGVPGVNGHEVPVAAVTLRRDRDIEPYELGPALAGLASDQQPIIVHVVAEIPRSTWYRPFKPFLRAAGLPSGGDMPMWIRNEDGSWSDAEADRLDALGVGSAG